MNDKGAATHTPGDPEAISVPWFPYHFGPEAWASRFHPKDVSGPSVELTEVENPVTRRLLAADGTTQLITVRERRTKPFGYSR